MRFSPESLADVKIPANAFKFLLEAGLPESAALFLEFEVPRNGSLPTVSQIWRLPETYSRFRVIGFNGSGDSICLDKNASGAIIYLNHDNSFERVLMNSSVTQLAESLLIVRRFLERGVMREREAQCLGALKNADEAAWQQSCFWRDEILALRDE